MNRIVRWIQNGYEMEADSRHCEPIVKQLGVENFKPLSTPGVESKDEEYGEEDDELSKAKASEYLGIAFIILWPTAWSCNTLLRKSSARC